MSKILPISRKLRLTKEEIAESIPYPEDSPTPSQMTKGDCCYPGAPRPCPLVSCRMNNYLTETDVGTIMLTWPELQPEDVPPEDSCAYDVAARGQSISDPMPFSKLKHFTGSTSRQNAVNVVEAAQRHARQILRELRTKLEEESE